VPSVRATVRYDPAMLEFPPIREVWDFTQPAESQRRFADLASRAEQAGLSSIALEYRTQVARALGLQERFDEAHAALDSVEDLLDDQDPVPGLRLLLERGRVLNSSGDPQRARPLFEAAWDLGRSVPHPDLAVDAAHMVAIVAAPEEKRRWNDLAVAYAEESGDPDAARWLGSLYNNMGWDAHDAGDYAEALRLHELCWEWHRERSTGSGERIAKWSVGKQLRFLGRLDEAAALQRELLDEYLEDEPGGEGFVHEELAEVLLASGREEQAAGHFGRAHELLRDVGWVEAERLSRMQRLAGHPAPPQPDG
jgi:tetratricopeptide (TPR) repeat protein